MKLVSLPLICSLLAFGQAAKEANDRYQTKEGRDQVAATLVSPTRDAQQKPEELVAAMAIKPGMTVADIGTGAGYMLPFLSAAVGPSGRVVAEDIFDDFLERARKRTAESKLSNVEFIKGSETDPNLPEGGVDIALALDSYHHYDYPEKMLAAIKRGLKPGGKLVVVEFYKRRDAMPGRDARQHIRADKPDVVKEIEAAGFRLVSEREHVKDSQYMVVFEK